jgi:CubicO group peptidase (beta-lactamase class C family)
MKRLPLVPILALAVATPLAAQPAHAPMLEQRDVETWLDGIVPYAIKAGDIAGAVVTVVADGKTIALKGYGEADVATRYGIDAGTVEKHIGEIFSKLGLFEDVAEHRRVLAGLTWLRNG